MRQRSRPEVRRTSLEGDFFLSGDDPLNPWECSQASRACKRRDASPSATLTAPETRRRLLWRPNEACGAALKGVRTSDDILLGKDSRLSGASRDLGKTREIFSFFFFFSKRPKDPPEAGGVSQPAHCYCIVYWSGQVAPAVL